MKTDFVIVGAGPAGYSAAICVACRGYLPIVLAGENPGGQARYAKKIMDLPIYPEGIDGHILMDQALSELEILDIHLVKESVVSVDLSRKEKVIYTEKMAYYAQAIIIASGSS